MIPDNDIKENLSLAYVRIIASMSGRVFYIYHPDYGMDVQIQEIQNIEGNLSPSGFNLDLQVKSTKNFRETDDHIFYPLRNKNYNDLTLITNGTPRILVLLCLPEDKIEWIYQSQDLLQLRKCSYWHYLGGQTRRPNPESKTTIRINRVHIFSVENLNRIFESIRGGSDLNEL